MENEFEEISCLYCECLERTNITTIGQFDIITNVTICKNCGFMYLNPRWTKDRYGRFYTHEYDKFYPREAENQASNDKLADDIFRRVRTFKEHTFKHIIDIGAGFGNILLNFKGKRFINASYYAIEPSLTCIDFLRNNNIEIVSDSVDSNWDEMNESKFDLVIMRHVLEHFLNPLEALQKVANILSDEGIAYIEVPDAYQPLSPLNSYYFRSVHVSYFSKDSLTAFCLKAGLAILSMVEDGEGNLFTVVKKSTVVVIPAEATLHAKQLKIIRDTYRNEQKQAKKLQPPGILHRLINKIRRTLN